MAKKPTKLEKTELKVKPITKREGWVFRVPANKQGEQFLTRLQKYINTDSYKITRRFSGPRPTTTSAHTVKKDAKSIRVYIETRGGESRDIPINPDIMSNIFNTSRENYELKQRLTKIKEALG